MCNDPVIIYVVTGSVVMDLYLAVAGGGGTGGHVAVYGHVAHLPCQRVVVLGLVHGLVIVPVDGHGFFGYFSCT